MNSWYVRYGVLAFASAALIAPLAAQRMDVAAHQDTRADVRTAGPLAKRVSITFENVSVMRAVDMLSASAGVRIFYRVELLSDYTRAISLKVSNQPLGEVLDHVLAGAGLEAVVTGPDALTLSPVANNVLVIQGTIVGRVVHAKTKQPIRGATLVVDNATPGISSREDGTFRIPANTGSHTLHVRAVGFVRQAVQVTVQENAATNITIALDPSASVLDEVIVTGTVVATERKAIPNPITVITAEEIEKRGITRIEEFFRGEVPGVFAQDYGTATYGGNSLGAMQTSQVFARGASHFNTPSNGIGNATTTPLKTYVDGVELLNSSYLGTIDPKSIDRIEIITGPQAATIYGSGAMGGVMQIFTKKGSNRTRPDFQLSLRYGILESNFSAGLTPSHNHSLAMTGGTGPEFSYSSSLSYRYTGQWQPKLFNRSFGGSIGATHSRGPFKVDGSANVTRGKNGTYRSMLPKAAELRLTGVWSTGEAYLPALSQHLSNAASQTLSLNVDYRISNIWQHHLTLGRNQTSFDLDPQTTELKYPSDSLLRVNASDGQRTSLSYNTTIFAPEMPIFSSVLTVGTNGSWGKQTTVSGCLATISSPAYIPCTQFQTVTVNAPRNDHSWGGFGTWRLGVFDRLFITSGVRGEHNPSYGDDHKIDWTPNIGAAYTVEASQFSLKLLASYGRATRAPTPGMREEVVNYPDPAFNVPQWIQIKAAPNLTPEYSSGPQGGIEMYYGNVGSLTINRYVQTVRDLIQLIRKVDSLPYNHSAGFSGYLDTDQYQNVASIRQQGWEFTGSANIRFLTVRGTYSWTDSRILSLNPNSDGASLYQPGTMFTNLPTHTANITLGYSHRGTSVSFVTNWIGAAMRNYTEHPHLWNQTWLRLRRSADRYKQQEGAAGLTYRISDYTKSHLSVSHQLTPSVSALMNVNNLGNSFASDGMRLSPTLGRQTTFGLSMRFPR